LARELAFRDRRRHVGDVAHLRREVARHVVHGVGQVLPRAGDTFHHRLAAELAFGADLAGDARHFRGERRELVHHRLDRVLELERKTVVSVDRSPFATAVVASAMLRTCAVRFPAIEFTESVKSFHVPATPCTSAWPPRRPSVPTSRATRVTSDANDESWSTIVLIVFLSSRISPFTSTVILFERSPFATAVVTSAILRTCDVRFD